MTTIFFTALNLFLLTLYSPLLYQENIIAPARLEQSVTANFSNATTYEVISWLNKNYDTNIVIDSFSSEQDRRLFFTWKDLPIQKVLHDFARTLNREIFFIGNIIVLRHRDWALAIEQEDSPAIIKQYSWRSAGTVTIIRVDKDITPGDFRFPNVKFPEWMRSDHSLPAQTVNISSNQSSANDFISAITRVSLWKVRISSEVRRRRISVAVREVNPGEVLSAVAFLLNAGPELSLVPSDAQKAMQAEAAKNDMPWDKASAKLRPDLLKALTDEEKQAVQRGERVDVPLSRITGELQTRVLDFIKMKAELIIKDGSQIDMSRMKDFRITFMPPNAAPGGSFGVTAPSINGILLYF